MPAVPGVSEADLRATLSSTNRSITELHSRTGTGARHGDDEEGLLARTVDGARGGHGRGAPLVSSASKRRWFVTSATPSTPSTLSQRRIAMGTRLPRGTIPPSAPRPSVAWTVTEGAPRPSS
ncbi:hypothetical protein GCM10010211_67830 [Streptomyces albospinus]|uniref:Uncharacterized protein n=1 Tax=Streptomyces albospinus TaxID=285515 RepID=A0ABQ2VLC7_9ACTN|nr:hypothetical protein GCM10010211_67830 [Streptomyces albospinus]